MAATLKIVLIGESGVGKSSILSQFTNGIFYPYLRSTFACSSDKKIIELKEINQAIDLELWDAAGRIEDRSIIKHFYKDADVIILCYDFNK